MNVLRKINLSILTVVFLSIVQMAFAQDINQAGTLFNEGMQAIKSKDYSTAITKLSSGLKVCNTIGDAANELKGKISTQLVKSHLNNAITLYKGRKFAEAIAAFENTKKIATEHKDAKTAKTAERLIPNVYVDEAKGLLKDKKYAEAHAAIEKSLGIKKNNAKATYVQALIYKEEDKIDEAGAALAQTIELDKSKTKKQAKQATKVAATMYEATAAKELQLEHAEKTLAYINEAVKYNDKSANAYYLMAVANNNLKKHEAAIEAANKGIALGDAKANSALQFELGKAYEGKGDKTNACAAYKKVTDGPNVEAAQFQIKEVLKCN